MSISKGKSNLSLTVVARKPTIGSPSYSMCSISVVSIYSCSILPSISLCNPIVTVSPILYVLKVEINSEADEISEAFIDLSKSPF